MQTHIVPTLFLFFPCIKMLLVDCNHIDKWEWCSCDNMNWHVISVLVGCCCFSTDDACTIHLIPSTEWITQLFQYCLLYTILLDFGPVLNFWRYVERQYHQTTHCQTASSRYVTWQSSDVTRGNSSKQECYVTWQTSDVTSNSRAARRKNTSWFEHCFRNESNTNGTYSMSIFSLHQDATCWL